MNCVLLKQLPFVDWGVVEGAMLKEFPKVYPLVIDLGCMGNVCFLGISGSMSMLHPQWSWKLEQGGLQRSRRKKRKLTKQHEENQKSEWRHAWPLLAEKGSLVCWRATPRVPRKMSSGCRGGHDVQRRIRHRSRQGHLGASAHPLAIWMAERFWTCEDIIIHECTALFFREFCLPHFWAIGAGIGLLETMRCRGDAEDQSSHLILEERTLQGPACQYYQDYYMFSPWDLLSYPSFSTEAPLQTTYPPFQGKVKKKLSQKWRKGGVSSVSFRECILHHLHLPSLTAKALKRNTPDPKASFSTTRSLGNYSQFDYSHMFLGYLATNYVYHVSVYLLKLDVA